MCIRSFLKPTKGKVAVFVLLLLFMAYIWNTRMSGFGYNPWDNADFLLIMSVPMAVPFLLLPTGLGSFLLFPYWYLIACIYISAYNWLDSTLRRKCPQINARWEKGVKHEGKK